MTFLLFLAALVTLLAAPGPTNALLLAAGASAGRIDVRLPVAAAMGYLVAVSLLGLVMGPMIQASPMLGYVLRIGANLYLIVLARKLWSSQPIRAEAGRGAIGPAPVFWTTLLNPKGMVIAFALLPQGWQASGASVSLYLTLVVSIVTAISAGWMMLGAHAARWLDPAGANRASAIVLGGFGLALGAGMVIG